MQFTQRVITEDFLKARCTGVGYFISQVNPPAPVKPKFTFQSPLLYGQSNYSCHMLQECLKWEGFFPNIPTTSYFGLITAKSLLKWQIAHRVAGLDELNSLMGKRAGQKTIDALNLIYSK
jgi:hypothetical protein